ncbi:hypothetical protein NIES2104_26450 [Leptolyngbya sp. NIES-2104]|nr:hypothetical protein NIES2104_26450 [Leptolyngbya sp. NIES-2104]
MKLSELLNELLDRGYNPEIFDGGIRCRINLDNESFGLTIAPSGTDFIRCLAWETYGGSYYFDRLFPNLNAAIFSAQFAAVLDDARLTELVSHVGR